MKFPLIFLMDNRNCYFDSILVLFTLSYTNNSTIIIIAYRYPFINSIIFIVFCFCYSGKFKCREVWMSKITEEIFNLSLNFILLIIPFFIMVIMYAKVSKTLYSSEFLSNHRTTRTHLSHNNMVHNIPLTKQENENLENEKQLHQCIGQRLPNDSRKNFISKNNSSTNSNKTKFKNEVRSTTKVTQDNNDNQFSTISTMDNYVPKEIDQRTIPLLTGTISPIQSESIEFDGNNILVIYNSKSGDVNLVESHLRKNFANQMKLDNDHVDNNIIGDLAKHKNNTKVSGNNGLSTRKQNTNVKSIIKTRFG